MRPLLWTESIMNESKQSALNDITLAVMDLLDSWGLQSREMQVMLALPESTKARAFQRLREGATVLPDDPVVLRRAQYLLRIADALRTTYPRNPRMGERWIKQRQSRLGSRTPLAMILDDGESGMISVLAHLDCTFSWDLSGSKPTGAATT